MSDLYQDKMFELDFKNTTYILHLIVNPEGLTLDLEKKSTGDIWIGQFTAVKLQENSQKTGNFKKYSVFIQMLLAAISSSNDSVELDLLTLQDLQQLKSKRMQQNQVKTQQGQTNASQNKLYLMLNYVAEFDKVHYPLQLILQSVPSVERQKQTIKRLRAEISIHQKESNSPQELVSENLNLKQESQMLRLRIKKFQENQSKLIQTPQIQTQEKIIVREVKDENLQKQCHQLRMQLATYQSQLNIHKSKLQHKQAENRELKQELQRLSEQIMDSSETREVKYQKDIKKMQQKLCKQFNEQLKSVSKETEDLVLELKRTKQQNKKQKLRIAELEKELSLMIKRNMSKQKIGGVTSSLINTKRSQTPRSIDRSKQKSFSKSKVSNNFSTSYNLRNSKSKDKKKENLSKRKSVMDSDTESSRMRKMNNRNVSPYRTATGGGIKRTPSNKSLKGNSPKSNRSHNKSQSKSRRQSQQSLNNSQIFTESESNFQNNFASDSDDESNNKISETVEMLRKNRQQRLKKGYTGDRGGDKNATLTSSRNQKNKQTGVERQIMNIAEMLKQSRKQLAD